MPRAVDLEKRVLQQVVDAGRIAGEPQQLAADDGREPGVQLLERVAMAVLVADHQRAQSLVRSVVG